MIYIKNGVIIVMGKIKMVFASANAGKIEEMKLLINKYLNNYEIELLGLKDVGFTGEIIEDGASFEANAEIKARAVYEHTGLICFADDSGLCVDYLNGGPGILTARYGGMDKLLHELKDVPDGKRSAHFYCAVYCVVSGSESFCVTGRCDGVITREKIGEGGFGYDPVFYYEPAGKTFAELDSGEKNKISHRARALELFAGEIVKYIY